MLKSPKSARHCSSSTWGLQPSDWKRRPAGEGTKGPWLHDWCYLEPADLDAEEFNEDNHGPWRHDLLIRRHITDGDLAYFTTWCPAGTSSETLVKIEGHRWAIEDSFETAKNEFGPDHNEPDRSMAGTATCLSSCSPLP
jgi:SRSO17 transposase